MCRIANLVATYLLTVKLTLISIAKSHCKENAKYNRYIIPRQQRLNLNFQSSPNNLQNFAIIKTKGTDRLNLLKGIPY